MTTREHKLELLRRVAGLRAEVEAMVAPTLSPIQRAVLLPMISRFFDLIDDVIKGDTSGN